MNIVRFLRLNFSSIILELSFFSTFVCVLVEKKNGFVKKDKYTWDDQTMDQIGHSSCKIQIQNGYIFRSSDERYRDRARHC